MNEKGIYTEALIKWGIAAQKAMLIEECAELIQATLKTFRESDEVTVDNMVEELADVQIMINQMKIIYGENQFEKHKLMKLDRLEKLLISKSAEKEEKE